MFNTIITLVRGRSHDAAQAVADANALSILRQQLRDAAGRERELPAKVTLRVAADDRLTIETPGGGGWGMAGESA